MLGLSVCVRRERDAPTPKPSPKRQRNPATASRPRWGLYPRAARGWGAHLAVGLCTGPRRWPGYFLPRPACVVRVANQLRGGGGYHRAVARPRGAPEVPRRAQRAQHASPEKPGACPAYRRRTGQGRACRLRSARKRRVGRARWGDAGRHAGHGAGGGLAKRHERAAKSASALDCAAAHGSGTSLLGRRATGTTPTRRPKGVLPTGTGRRVAH